MIYLVFNRSDAEFLTIYQIIRLNYPETVRYIGSLISYIFQLSHERGNTDENHRKYYMADSFRLGVCRYSLHYRSCVLHQYNRDTFWTTAFQAC